MKNTITKKRLEKYFSITSEALEKAKAALDETRLSDAEDFLDMATRYFQDAKHFQEKGDLVTAFAALNYAHGWLDAGARIKLFKVSDNKLFTVD
ncbi:MAG: DUF357 domain-containing protein [Nanoarchaeota archaeon]|nr:DUF357 domain-containing protein [Nanoarchaeota archaeon]